VGIAGFSLDLLAELLLQASPDSRTGTTGRTGGRRYSCELRKDVSQMAGIQSKNLTK
jgi:hypothetical protein